MLRTYSVLMQVARSTGLLAVVVGGMLSIIASGGGSNVSTPPPTLHNVTISWAANRETAVNSVGGGYTVNISGQPSIDVPYVSGPSTPTSTQVSLWSGRYTVTVVGYSALNAPGRTGSTSAPSATLTVDVPY